MKARIIQIKPISNGMTSRCHIIDNNITYIKYGTKDELLSYLIDNLGIQFHKIRKINGLYSLSTYDKTIIK